MLPRPGATATCGGDRGRRSLLEWARVTTGCMGAAECQRQNGARPDVSPGAGDEVGDARPSRRPGVPVLGDGPVGGVARGWWRYDSRRELLSELRGRPVRHRAALRRPAQHVREQSQSYCFSLPAACTCRKDCACVEALCDLPNIVTCTDDGGVIVVTYKQPPTRPLASTDWGYSSNSARTLDGDAPRRPTRLERLQAGPPPFRRR